MATLYNTNAEMCVLGCMILDEEHLAHCLDVLNPGDFYLPSHRAVFEAIKRLHENEVAVDLVLVRDAIEQGVGLDYIGGTDALMNMTEGYTSPTYMLDYIDIIKDYALKRRLIHLSQEIIREVQVGGSGAADIVTTLEARAAELGGDAFNDDGHLVTLVDGVQYAGEVFYNAHQADMRDAVITTGISSLDEVVEIDGATYAVVLARPSHGKTTFAINMFLANARRGLKGYFASAELSWKRLSKNILVRMANVDNTDARRGKLDENSLNRLVETANNANLPGWLDSKPFNSVDELCRRIRRGVRKYGCSFAMIDYLQLIPGKGEGPVERIQNTSMAVAALKNELGIPIIGLVQANRECEYRSDKRPIASDIKGSGQIEQDVDIILALFRECNYDVDNPELRHKIEVVVRKNRDGESGAVVTTFCDMDKYKIGRD